MSADWKPIWQTIKQWNGEGRNVALATVIDTWGSSPRPTGSHMIVDSLGNIEGSVSGGCIEGAVIQSAEEVMKSKIPQILDFSVTNDQAWEVGLSCGGRVRVLVETIDHKINLADKILSASGPVILKTNCITGKTEFLLGQNNAGKSKLIEEGPEATFVQILDQPMQMIIVGAVHISQAMVKIAQALDISISIIDPRTAFASSKRFPDCNLSQDWPDEALDKMVITSGTAIVTLTHDPKLDDPALEIAIKSDAFYIASLGSRKTHAARVARLQEKGFSPEEIDKIHGPAGVDIGAKTPAEIALSVMAQLVSMYRIGDDK